MKGYNLAYGDKILKVGDTCTVVDGGCRAGWDDYSMPKTIGNRVKVIEIKNSKWIVCDIIGDRGWIYNSDDLRLVDKKEEAKRVKELIDNMNEQLVIIKNKESR